MPSVANVEVGIVADDLTGALDSAAAFCTPAARVSVELWDPAPGTVPATATDPTATDPTASVVAIATASRDLSPRLGEPLLRGALSALLARKPRTLLLKIDSQLRGHPARDVAVALSLSPAGTLAVVAPAFPGHGRTTAGGIHRVGEATAGIDVPALLEGAGLPTAQLGFELVRSGTLASGFSRLRDAGIRVAVVDAETDDDLRAIARAGEGPAQAVLWVGSAGLAAALAGQVAIGRSAETLTPETSAPETSAPLRTVSDAPGTASDSAGPASAPRILVVAGSASSQTARQVAGLVSAGAAHVVVSGEPFGPAFEEGAEELRAALTSNPVVVLSSGVAASGIDAPHGRFAACLANTVAAAVRPTVVDGLIFSGGETMAATCRVLGIHSLEVRGEGELGVPHSVSRGALVVHITSKAGAFGDDGALVRAVSRLSDSIRNHPISGSDTDHRHHTDKQSSTEGANG
jgi:uncharacterized protein YgbK (DUF1537 family)